MLAGGEDRSFPMPFVAVAERGVTAEMLPMSLPPVVVEVQKLERHLADSWVPWPGAVD